MACIKLRGNFRAFQRLSTGGIPVGVEIMLAILCSVLGGFPPDAKPVWAEQSKPIVILLDATANGFTYRIDGSPVPLSEIRRTLQRKWDKGKTHEEQARVIILMHERSEEHTSELQSPCNLVCRLLLEKKNK